MGRAARIYDEHGIYFVRASFRPGRELKPSKRVNLIAGGVLARAVRHYGIGLRGFALTANGLELLVKAKGTSLSHFMRFLLSTLSRKLSALCGWSGGLWNGRFRLEPVLDPQAEVACLIALIRGALDAALTGAWPPLTCLPWLLPHATKPRFRYFEWSRRALDPRHFRHVSRWSSALGVEEFLELERVSSWAHFSNEVVTTLVQSIADGAPASAPPERAKEGIWSTSPLVRQQFLEACRRFRSAYARASHSFRSGHPAVEFPPYCFRPSAPHDPLAEHALKSPSRARGRYGGERALRPSLS